MDAKVQEVQHWLNETYGASGHAGWVYVPESGMTGWDTVYGLTRALQMELGITALSSNFGPSTQANFVSLVGQVSSSSSPRIIRIAQGALWCKGYDGGPTWYRYDATTAANVRKLTGDMGLTPVDTISVKVMKSLLTMDAYTVIGRGTAAVREVQRWLNGTYANRRDFAILPCDGVFSRGTQLGLTYAIQYEAGMADGVANGNFGPGTKQALRTAAHVGSGSTGHWVSLFQAVLRCNGYTVPFTGRFDAATQTVTRQFQTFAALPVTGVGDFATWASLLIATGDPDRPAIACDTSTPLISTTAAALYSAGYRTVGRYLTVNTKRYRPDELEVIFDAGLATMPIMQEDATKAENFSATEGASAGFQAARRLRQLGFKPGVTVFFAVDYDATDDFITSNVIPHFRAIKTAMNNTRGGYKIGVYGTRHICERVLTAGLAEEAYISSISWGWSGNLGFPLPHTWSYDQIQTLTPPGSGIEIDKVVQSPHAHPVHRSEVDPAPLQNFHWDPLYWMVTHLTVLAEENYPRVRVIDQTHAVLDYLQHHLDNDGANDYGDLEFGAYLPWDSSPTQGYEYLAAQAEQNTPASETRFILNYTTPTITKQSTSHMAVTARGYAIHGRPTDSQHGRISSPTLVAGHWISIRSGETSRMRTPTARSKSSGRGCKCAWAHARILRSIMTTWSATSMAF